MLYRIYDQIELYIGQCRPMASCLLIHDEVKIILKT